MATITTSKKFHPRHIFALLGGDLADLSTNGIPLDADGEKVLMVTVKGDGETPITQEELDAIVASYTYDPDFGKTEEEREFSRLRAKAQAVFNGTDTFTAAQVQKILAGLVLRATR